MRGKGLEADMLASSSGCLHHTCKRAREETQRIDEQAHKTEAEKDTVRGSVRGVLLGQAHASGHSDGAEHGVGPLASKVLVQTAVICSTVVTSSAQRPV